MMGNWFRWLACVWLLGLAGTAFPCLAGERGSWQRDGWIAAAVVSFPLLWKLVRLAVAAPTAPRKILSVLWDMMFRFGMTLALAALLFFGVEAGLTDRFWFGLAVFYQVALALETGLLLQEWNAGTTAEPGGPVK